MKFCRHCGKELYKDDVCCPACNTIVGSGKSFCATCGKPVNGEENCPNCGMPLVIRKGRFGEFVACSNYPECKNIKNVNNIVGTCPKCGKDIIEKTSKKFRKEKYVFL